MSVIPLHQRGYTNPQLLAETDWLAKHMDDPAVRIVDARPPQQYAAGHIPGAVNLPGTNGIPRTADGEMASAARRFDSTHIPLLFQGFGFGTSGEEVGRL